MMLPPPELAPPPPAPLALGVEPLAGFSDGTAFLRSPDNLFILFPSGRLQIDGYFFHTEDSKQVPNNTFLLRRARGEVQGWIGPWFYFYLAGDYASSPPATGQSNLITTDDYIAVAPRQNLLILQYGQFDAPFTLENRTSDKYFDFMERSITVRAFGIPDNKEIGWMASGYNEPRNWYYSVGVFNGDGQNFKNQDEFFDVMGRVWVAPFSFANIEAMHDMEVGFSWWTGNRNNTLPLQAQTTQGGFQFLGNSFNSTIAGGMMSTPISLRQNGRLEAFAGEVNFPYDHKYGLRWELVWRDSPLSAENVAGSTPVVLGGMELKGFSTYGELWWWALGDDRIIGDQQGIQPLTRFKKFGIRPPQDGIMLAFRVEFLDEDVTNESDTVAAMLNDPYAGKTKVNSYELGINYWHSKRFRTTFNFVYNHFSGDTAFVKGLASPNEFEFLYRLAIAL
jgi:phosphate-selective porin